MKGLIAAAVAMSTAVLVGAGVASAAPREAEPFTCDGITYQLLTAPANGAENAFGVGQIVGGGHLIPTSFTFSAYDETTDAPLFEDSTTKGGGNGNHNQQTVSCSTSQTGTLADFLEPGDEVPPGVSLTDVVTITFSATAVLKQK